MADLLFANNASSIVAVPINAAAVTVTVSDATSYPVPGADEYFIATFVDAATGLLREIVHVTAVSGNDLTIARAQEGTTALSWNVGDVLANFWTAGAAQAMLQQAQQQSQSANYGVDTGGVNAMIVALDPAPTALSSIVGTPVRVRVNFKNTSTAVTLNLNGLGVQAVRLPDGTLPFIGMLVNGATYELMWNGTWFQVTNVLDFSASLPFAVGTGTANYQKFPTGLIIQFGNFTPATGFRDLLTLPTTFVTRAFSSCATTVTGNSNIPAVATMNPNSAAPVTQYQVSCSFWNGSGWSLSAGGVNIGWVAWGY